MTRSSHLDMARTLEDSELVARAKRGDIGAFETLLAEHLPRVRRFARSMSTCDAEADDLAQDALLKVYVSLGSYRFESAFSTWLFRVVRNTCIDRARRAASRQMHQQHPLEAAANVPETDAALADDRIAQQELHALLWEGLRALPVEFRSVVVLSDVEGLSQEQVAAIERVPVGTVKSRASRGRRLLRAWLVARGFGRNGNESEFDCVLPERSLP